MQRKIELLFSGFFQMEIENLLSIFQLKGLLKKGEILYAKGSNGKYQKQYSLREFVWTFCKEPRCANSLVNEFRLGFERRSAKKSPLMLKFEKAVKYIGNHKYNSGFKILTILADSGWLEKNKKLNFLFGLYQNCIDKYQNFNDLSLLEFYESRAKSSDNNPYSCNYYAWMCSNIMANTLENQELALYYYQKAHALGCPKSLGNLQYLLNSLNYKLKNTFEESMLSFIFKASTILGDFKTLSESKYIEILKTWQKCDWPIDDDLVAFCLNRANVLQFNGTVNAFSCNLLGYIYANRPDLFDKNFEECAKLAAHYYTKAFDAGMQLAGVNLEYWLNTECHNKRVSYCRCKCFPKRPKQGLERMLTVVGAQDYNLAGGFKGTKKCIGCFSACEP